MSSDAPDPRSTTGSPAGTPVRPALGSQYDGTTTTFRVRSAPSSAVDVCLLLPRDGFDGSDLRSAYVEERVRMDRRSDHPDVWEARVPAPPGTRYGFRAHGPWVPEQGLRTNPSLLLMDPYTRGVDLPSDPSYPDHPDLYGHHRDDDPHVTLGRLDRPGGLVRRYADSAPVAPWSVVLPPVAPRPSTRPRVPRGEQVVYEAHVGHSTRTHPGVPEADRGRYAGLAAPAFVDHLLRIGVTTVELLPVHQFASEPALVRRGRANAWGYNTLAFFAPHAAYAGSSDPVEREEELAAAVRALHEAGLEVLLDVVYNHTAEAGGDGPSYHLRGLDQPGYYRLHGGHTVDWTGCGHTVDVRRPAAHDLVLDSLRHWAERYDVDGFRFDLAPALGRGDEAFDPDHPLLAAILADPVLGGLTLVPEPWDLGPHGWQVGGFTGAGPAGARWSEWNDRFRDDVRRFWTGRSDLPPYVRALAGSSDVFEGSGRAPYHVVNFVTAHDGFTVRDLVSYDHKHNEANGEDNRDGTDNNHSWNGGVEGPTDDEGVRRDRLRRQAGLLSSLLLALGTPMFTAGDERDRTQHGNNNPYCVDDPTVWVDWTDTPEADLLQRLTGVLTTLRREQPVLRGTAFLRGRVDDGPGEPDVLWLRPDGSEVTDWHGHERVLGMLLSGVPGPDAPARRLLLWANGGSHPHDVVLPDAPATTWTVRVDTGADGFGLATTDRTAAPGARIPLVGWGVLALAG